MDHNPDQHPQQVPAMDAGGMNGPAPNNVDLERILTAWNTATEKLQQTHHTLRAEVKRLTDELEVKNRELARKNRLADLGQMASHIAHEVRNSLMPMTLYFSLLRRRLTDDSDTIDILGKLDSGLQALDATVNDLLHFTREREPVRTMVPLGLLAAEVCHSLAPQCDAQSIRVSVHMDHDLQLSVDREMIRRALLNLVLNAIDIMPDGGDLNIIGQNTADGVELVVQDTGAGIPPGNLHQLFEPFFTTKGTGTGLGLAIVERIATAHGGKVTVKNIEPHGAAFCLNFPQPVDQSLHQSASESQSRSGRSPTRPYVHSPRKAAA